MGASRSRYLWYRRNAESFKPQRIEVVSADLGHPTTPLLLVKVSMRCLKGYSRLLHSSSDEVGTPYQILMVELERVPTY